MKKKTIKKVLKALNVQGYLDFDGNKEQYKGAIDEVQHYFTKQKKEKQPTEPLEVGDLVTVIKGNFDGKEAFVIEDNGANYFAKIQIVGSEIVVHINHKRLKKIEPKELSFEELKDKFPIGSKAKVLNDYGEYVRANDELVVDGYFDHRICNGGENWIGILFDNVYMCRFCDLEPIQEPKKFNVGDRVIDKSPYLINNYGRIKKIEDDRIYVVFSNENTPSIYPINTSILKLLPND